MRTTPSTTTIEGHELHRDDHAVQAATAGRRSMRATTPTDPIIALGTAGGAAS